MNQGLRGYTQITAKWWNSAISSIAYFLETTMSTSTSTSGFTGFRSLDYEYWILVPPICDTLYCTCTGTLPITYVVALRSIFAAQLCARFAGLLLQVFPATLMQTKVGMVEGSRA